ncbi:hypothetical protein, partial [Komagataeibacter rhaeticus]|uniref:hypothetical protein n=1 Tax=Komagataeibacter rhaeticus TaxID=215221 RepID=UPI001CD52C66
VVSTATVRTAGFAGTCHAFGGESLAVTTACVSVSVFHAYRYTFRYILLKDISEYIFIISDKPVLSAAAGSPPVSPLP